MSKPNQILWIVPIFVFGTLSVMQAQPDNFVKGVVIANLRSGTVPSGRPQLSIDDLSSPRLRSVLAVLQCQKIEKVFKHFEPSDTNGLDLLGRPIKLIDLSGYVRLHFDQHLDLNEIINSLQKLDVVVTAEKDSYIKKTSTFPSELPLGDPAKQRTQWGGFITPTTESARPGKILTQRLLGISKLEEMMLWLQCSGMEWITRIQT